MAVHARQGTAPASVALDKLAVKLERGQRFGRLKMGLFCAPAGSLGWQGKHAQIDLDGLRAAFRHELAAAGAAAEVMDQADYRVDATINALSASICLPKSGLGDMTTAKGEAIMDIAWRLYNRDHRGAARDLSTRGRVQWREAGAGGVEAIVLAAFVENVRSLMAQAAFPIKATGVADPR